MLTFFYFSGKIVGDSTAFRNGKSIWPEGYTATRKFTSVTGEAFFVFLIQDVCMSFFCLIF
jgi:hypothetical protein